MIAPVIYQRNYQNRLVLVDDISDLLAELTNLHFRHPETNARMIYALV